MVEIKPNESPLLYDTVSLPAVKINSRLSGSGCTCGEAF